MKNLAATRLICVARLIVIARSVSSNLCYLPHIELLVFFQGCQVIVTPLCLGVERNCLEIECFMFPQIYQEYKHAHCDRLTQNGTVISKQCMDMLNVNGFPFSLERL